MSLSACKLLKCCMVTQPGCGIASSAVAMGFWSQLQKTVLQGMPHFQLRTNVLQMLILCGGSRWLSQAQHLILSETTATASCHLPAYGSRIAGPCYAVLYHENLGCDRTSMYLPFVHFPLSFRCVDTIPNV